MGHKDRRGFTLVELLVVIAIIGILVALLLPAVQAAREAARRAQCRNHLKQLALGAHLHESAQDYFPSGGWGDWVGDADRGFGKSQPGSYLYSILPYIDQEILHAMGKGLSFDEKKLANAERNRKPVAVFYCPSRRASQAYPPYPGMYFHNAPEVELTGKNDYAASMGSGLPRSGGYPSPSSYAAEDTWPWPAAETFNGVCHLRSMVPLRDITDGASNTYFCGEKHLNPDNYTAHTTTSYDQGDDQGAYCGFNADVYRSTNYRFAPIQDTPGLHAPVRFGSAHAGSLHMGFCDGSVQAISYEIDLVVHENLGNREDGAVIDKSKL